MIPEERHRHIQDALAAYALNALDAPERDEVTRHLAGCAECQALLLEYEAVTELLPYGLPLTSPSPEAKTRLLTAARASAASGGRAATPPTTPARRGVVWAWGSFVVVAGMVLLAGWTLKVQEQVWYLQTTMDTAHLATVSDEEIIPLGGVGQTEANARLYVAQNRQQGVLAIEGLPPLPQDRVYQLWFALPDRSVQSGGAFQVNSDGAVLVQVVIPYPLDSVSALAITEEAAPHADQPTTAHLLEGTP